MASELKAEEIKEYYLGKLREAEQQASIASGQEERVKWRKIALGYERLAGVPASEIDPDHTITEIRPRPHTR